MTNEKLSYHFTFEETNDTEKLNLFKERRNRERSRDTEAFFGVESLEEDSNVIDSFERANKGNINFTMFVNHSLQVMKLLKEHRGNV